MDPGHVGGDRAEQAADLGGGVGLGVEGLVLRGAALELQEDDVPGPAEGRPVEPASERRVGRRGVRRADVGSGPQ
jgi:hypothetical protein